MNISFFKTKKDLTSYTRQLIDDHKGNTLTPTSPLYPFFLSLLERHPRWQEKSATPITAIRINHGTRTTPEIELLYDDNTSTGISWKKAITPTPTNPLALENKAFRSTIQDQIDAFRSSHCEQCWRRGTDVDHVIPFKTLVEAFKQTALDYWGSAATQRYSVYKQGTEYFFVDPATAQAWWEYHKNNASLQMLCKVCHKRKTFLFS